MFRFAENWGATKSQLSSVAPISWISTSVDAPPAAHLVAKRGAVDLDEIHVRCSIRQRDRRSHQWPAIRRKGQRRSRARTQFLFAEITEHLSHHHARRGDIDDSEISIDALHAAHGGERQRTRVKQP